MFFSTSMDPSPLGWSRPWTWPRSAEVWILREDPWAHGHDFFLMQITYRLPGMMIPWVRIEAPRVAFFFFFIFWVLKIEESRLSLPRGETPGNVGFSLAVLFRGYVFFWQVVVEAKGAKSCAFSTFVVHESTFLVGRCTIAFCSVVFKRSLCWDF